MRRQPATLRPGGFTLLELMLALAVAGVLVAAGLPNLRAFVGAQRLRTATADMFDAIALARAQAIARNAQVKMAPRDPEGADWTRGWTVFVDRDGDRSPGPGDEIIAEHGPLPKEVAVSFSFTAPAAPYYIAYNGSGRSCRDTNSAAARMGTLSLFHDGRVRRIKINMLGRPRICDPARDSNCDGPKAPP